MGAMDKKSKTALAAWLYLSLGLVQAAHSVEEVITGLWKNLPVVTGWMNAEVSSFPVMEWSAEGFAAANLVIVAVMLALSPFPFLRHSWALRMIPVIAVIEMINGLIHILPAIVKGGYYPGVVSAVFLFILGTVTLVVIRRSHAIQTV